MILTPQLHVVVLIILSHTSTAQHATTKHDVQQRVVDVFDALSSRNAADLRQLCAANVRFYEYGKAWPIDTLIDLAITKNTAADFKRTNKFDFIDTIIQGNTAWTTYYLQSDITNNGKNNSIYWLETVILVLENRRWMIKVLHSTRLNKSC